VRRNEFQQSTVVKSGYTLDLHVDNLT